jgi:hypothetical protein
MLPFETASLVEMVSQNRWRLHDLLREYAALKLNADPNESDAAHRAHASFLIALFDGHYTVDPSTAPHVALELDNLREAAARAMARSDGSLLATLATKPRNWLYNVFRINAEWEDWLTQALKSGIEDRQLEANVLQAIGDVQQFRDERDAAPKSYEQALQLFRAVGDRLGEANVYLAHCGAQLAWPIWSSKFLLRGSPGWKRSWQVDGGVREERVGW